MLRSNVSSNLPMVQDLLTDLCSSNMDLVNQAVRISVNASSWHSTCNPSVNGKRHGTRRTPRFDERFISLVPRTAFRCVFSGLWRSRWPGFATAPSLRSNRQPHTDFGFGAAWHTTNIYSGCYQFDEHSRELECEWNRWRQCRGRDDQHEWRLHFAGRSARIRFGNCPGYQRRRQLEERNRRGDRYERHLGFRITADDARGTRRRAAIRGVRKLCW